MKYLTFLVLLLALISCQKGEVEKKTEESISKVVAETELLPTTMRYDQLVAKYKGLLPGLPEFDFTKSSSNQTESDEFRKTVGLYVEESKYETFLKKNIFTFRQEKFSWGNSPLPTWRFVKVVDFDKEKNKYSLSGDGSVQYFSTAKDLYEKEALEKYRKLAGPDIEKNGFQNIIEEKKQDNSQIESAEFNSEEVSQFVLQFLVHLVNVNKETLQKLISPMCIFESIDDSRWTSKADGDLNETFARLKNISELFRGQYLESRTTFRMGIDIFENIDKSKFVSDFQGGVLVELVTDDNYNALELGIQKKGDSYEVIYIKNLIYAM